jgi:tRNA(Ile)-lysidine synthase
VIRPLLDVSRAEIDAYANEHGLHPREDATNRDLTYVRNRLRHEIIPLLETLNPNLKATLARTAAILRADADLIAQYGEAALARVLITARENTVILDRGAWGTLRLAEKRYVIRVAFRRVGPDAVELAFDHVAGAISVADHGGTGAAATLPGGVMLRVERTTLTLAPPDRIVTDPDAPALPPGYQGAPFAAGEVFRQQVGGWAFEAHPLPAGADLSAFHADPLAAALAIRAGTPLVLRTRAPGDRFKPRGMGGRSQKLADTFNAMGVPAARRDHVPLLIAEDEIGWFVAPTPAGVRGRVAEACAIPESHPENGIVIVRWQRADLYQT